MSDLISKSDLKTALKNSPAVKAKALAEDMETLSSVWRVLNTSLELLADASKEGGKLTPQDAYMFTARKGLAIAGVAGGNASQGVQVATFMANQTMGTVEMGMGAVKYAKSPGQMGVFISMKVAEKVVSAAGLGQVDKCQQALMALTVSAGVNVFTCVASGGALCILGAASFALEAFNAHAQCQLPPPG